MTNPTISAEDLTGEYKSKSIADVIHDLEDRKFWQLANEVAKDGTRKDAANMLRKLCEELVQTRQAEQAAYERAAQCVPKHMGALARKIRALAQEPEKVG